MNRLVAVLIIPFLAFGNVIAHTHTGIETANHHTHRPHVHVAASHHTHAQHHHHHGHEEAESEQSEQRATKLPLDHDSTAVYLSGDQFFLPTSAGSTAEIQIDCIGFVASKYIPGSRGVRPHVMGQEVPIRSGPPLFLLHAALRL